MYVDLELAPYCMPTYNVEIADRNNWRETLSTFGKKWITDQRTEMMQKKITWNKRSIDYWQGVPKELLEKTD